MTTIWTFLLVISVGIIAGLKIQINTKAGEIHGFVQKTTFQNQSGSVVTFLGIPYAQPPIGNLRFRKPRPFTFFKHPFNASEYGPGCLQNKFLMSSWLPGRNYLSEDCLTLNIFQPNNGRPGLKSVMIWIHGGAFQIGQSSIYSGENLAFIEDVIVVTMNYRLGPFGFLATEDPDALGNLGLWDQQLAIKWVKNNIGFFGGDNTKITLFGESAGGASTVFQAMYPGNRGLFARTISESGVAMSAWGYNSREKMLIYTKRMAANLQCPTTNDSAMLDCMRKRSSQDIIDKSRVGTSLENLFRPEFVPAPDGEFISQYPPSVFSRPTLISHKTGAVFDNIDMAFVALTGDGTVVTGATMYPYVQKLKSDKMTPDEVIEKVIIPQMLFDRFNMTSDQLAKTMAFIYTDWNQTLGNKSYETKLLNLDTDYSFYIPIINTAIAHAQREVGKKTYLLGFERHSSFTKSLDYKPANLHADEIPYFFGFPNSVLRPFAMSRTNITADEIDTSRRLMTYIANFAKTG